MKKQRITVSDAAALDILEQAAWYQDQSDHKLAGRWENAVTSTLLRILQNPRLWSAVPFQITRAQ